MSTGDRQDLLHSTTGHLRLAISDVATSMRVATDDGTWPSTFPFYVTLDEALESPLAAPARGHEAVRVDGIAGDVFTIARGQLGTAARVHDQDAAVALGMNRADVSRLLAQLEQGGAGAADVQSITFSIPGAQTAPVAGKARWYANRALTLVSVRASVSASGVAYTLDVHKNGTTIFTNQANRPQIGSGVNTDLADALDVAAMAQGDFLTCDLDVGNLPGGEVLTVEVEYTVN